MIILGKKIIYKKVNLKIGNFQRSQNSFKRCRLFGYFRTIFMGEPMTQNGPFWSQRMPAQSSKKKIVKILKKKIKNILNLNTLFYLYFFNNHNFYSSSQFIYFGFVPILQNTNLKHSEIRNPFPSHNIERIELPQSRHRRVAGQYVRLLLATVQYSVLLFGILVRLSLPQLAIFIVENPFQSGVQVFVVCLFTVYRGVVNG